MCKLLKTSATESVVISKSQFATLLALQKNPTAPQPKSSTFY